MHFDEFGVGFNEHTICEVRDWQQDDTRIRTMLDCENVYVWDDGSVHRVFQQSFAITIVPISYDTVTVQDDGDPEMVVYHRCE